MWNLHHPTEYRVGNNSTYPLGGLAPLRQDQARHAHLEKKWLHAEMARHQHAQALTDGVLSAIRHAMRALRAGAQHLPAHLHRSAALKTQAPKST